MKSFTIRPALPGDLAVVERALLAAGLPTAGVRDRFESGYAVADTAGEIIGAAGVEVHNEYGLLRSAVVVPAWQGKGVGDALTRDRIAWARQQQLHALYLLTNTAAGYFPRFGFLPVERAQAPNAIQASLEFAEICCASATVMTLPLSAAALTSLTEEVRIMLGAGDGSGDDLPISKA